MVRIAAVFLAPLVVYALPSGSIGGTSRPIGTAQPVTIAMPDVVVTDLTVDDKCQVVAHFANKGTGSIPPEVVNLTLELSGIAKVMGYIPADKLRAPGSTFDYVASGTGKATPTAASQTVSLLATNPVMAEPNKSNNSFGKNLTCTAVPPGPDLALSITTNADCTKTLTLANIGDAAPDPSLWRAIPIIRRIDDIYFEEVQVSVLDPQQALAKPGGKVTWNEPAELRAYDHFEYQVRYGPYEKGDSKANNIASASVPASCKGTRPPVDVAVTEVRLAAGFTTCRFEAHVRNAGTTTLPPFSFAVQFSKGDKSLGQWGTLARTIAAPGAETWVMGPDVSDVTAVPLKAALAAPGLVQTRTDNDVAAASLACVNRRTISVQQINGGVVH